jgi:hypothetical protein
MLRLIMCIASSDLQACSGFDFAWIELTEKAIQDWLDHIGMAVRMGNEDSSFSSIGYWNYEAHYCETPEQDFDEMFGDKWADKYEYEGQLIEPESFTPPVYKEQRTECDLVQFTPTGMWWTAVPKHGDLPVETPHISPREIQGFLDRLRGNHLNKE